jgi:DNA-directed RNA polymerase subunit H (RpoH/RPB5)
MQQQEILFKNILTMFFHRGTIKEDDIESQFNTLILNFNETTLQTSCDYFTIEIIKKKVFIKKSDTEQECFLINELFINPYSHVYSPKIRILSEEDKIKFLNDMKISFDTLPQIKISDPIARYFNLKLDTIIEIERKSKVTITSLYYRRVVA